jgi:signal transduction histidine kinase
MSKEKLLFVDDEENVLKSLVRLFQENNYRILTARSGREGLELISKDKVQLIISDYRMPEMNGIEFLKRVKMICPDTIRMILTGYADLDIAVSAINEGYVYKFITKPWDSELFKITVKRALEFHNLMIEKQSLNKKLIEKNKELKEINENLEQIVEERTQQLLHSEKMATLGQIAGQIGHEINNVLSILIGKMELLKGKKKINNKYVEDTLKVFSEQFNRLKVHSKNLLTFGKPIPSDFKNVSLKEILDKTIDNLIFSGILKYYKIDKEYENNLPLIYGDALQIDQVFINLFVNAHHSMGKNGTISVMIKVPDDKKFIEVHIKDTGKGIPEENLEKIFEPFFTTKLEGKGTGLGLTVVKKIVESHKGYIKVKSQVNYGTIMIIGFPVIKN